MRIQSIKIENLFDIFDYDISFKSEENILLITGPNGYGKTTILSIIYHLFNQKFFFFQKLVFDKITVRLDDDIKIVVSRSMILLERFGQNNDTYDINFRFYEGGDELENRTYSHSSTISEKEIERIISRNLPLSLISENEWIDIRNDKIWTTDEVISEYEDMLPPEISESIFKVKSPKAIAILDSIQTHLIREQRLFKRAQLKGNNRRLFGKEELQSVMVNTIQTYANELKQFIGDVSQKSFAKTQELDSNYPKRLTNTNTADILKKEEYEAKYKELEDKQRRLHKFGLYESIQEFLTYNEEDAKALTVYLRDFESKLNVFDELVEKLELFTSVLNERRFTFKSIKINGINGFYFETNKGKKLELSQLSSGEQHEVVLLYELIFNVKANVLVLIDEPEISLHVAWQKDFLSDLLKIIKIQNIQVLIATHSPSIINDRWDLVYNLEATPNK